MNRGGIGTSRGGGFVECGIPQDLVNITDLTVSRPTRTGPSMDQVGTATPIVTNVCAIYEPVHQLLQELDGRSILVTSQFWIDAYDDDGDPLDVRAHDHLEYTDWRGVKQKRKLILRVTPAFACAELHHLTLGIG